LVVASAKAISTATNAAAITATPALQVLLGWFRAFSASSAKLKSLLAPFALLISRWSVLSAAARRVGCLPIGAQSWGCVWFIFR